MGDIPCPCRMKVLFLLLPLSCHSLNIDLYYESLCPDSTRFIADQIPETWSALKEDIFINFVPYGFAKTTERPDGSYTFKCQHGERECKGNKIQACTAHLFSDNPDTAVSLITCMMDANAPDMAGPGCYQKQGEATANYRPRIDNVPWLNFDGEHVAEYWDLETVGLLNYLPAVPAQWMSLTFFERWP